MARYARDGSNALSKGRSRNEMTRLGSVRSAKWSAIAKLKPVVTLAMRRRVVCDLVCSDAVLVDKGVTGL